MSARPYNNALPANVQVRYLLSLALHSISLVATENEESQPFDLVSYLPCNGISATPLNSKYVPFQ